MEKKLDFTKVPYRYTLCLERQCAKAETCLRQVAERNAPNDISCWQILRPAHLASLKDTCPYYRSTQKLRYAKGFVNLLDNLPGKQARKVINDLMNQFSRRTYYRMRSGERLLTPAEQQLVYAILKRCGVVDTPKFDAYLEDFDWE